MSIFQFKPDQWQAYKAIRLEALSRHENVYGNSFAMESEWNDAQWQDMLGADDKAFFGLSDVRGDVIGCACVFTDRDDPSGRAALLAGAYIRSEYRGKNLSHYLYQARLDWIRSSGRFDNVRVGHKEGNEASRRANKAFGFSYVDQVKKAWGDGSQGVLHRYELRMS